MEVAKIRVAVRKRPLTRKEIRHNEEDIIDQVDPQTLVVREPKVKVDLTKYIECHNFKFDSVYSEDVSNEEIYLDSVQPLIYSAFEKAKITCFAYGQTGSGKTHTMMGEPGIPGLYCMAASEIFSLIERQYHSITVHISFFEIYWGKLRDLLNEKQELFCREDYRQRVNIVGLSEIQAENVDHLMQCIEVGLGERATGVTAANDESSRSHAVLQITLKNNGKVHGKASFIDLAGSERGADTAENGKQTRIDGAEINKSLLALKECIRALDMDKRHTPFRGSKLTQVLKDSFMGNARSLMVANISPAKYNCEHTLNTLRYADRVRELKKGGSSDPKRMQDMLSNALMLPRQPSAATKLPQKTNGSMGIPNPTTPNLPKNNSLLAVKKEVSPNTRPQTAQNTTNYSPPAKQLISRLPMPGSSRQRATSTITPQPTTNKPAPRPAPTPMAPDPIVSQNIVDPKFLDPSWTAHNEDELQQISDEHEGLIGTILIKEEDLIKSHRQHIDNTVDSVKQEMVLLHEVDKPGSDVDDYIKALDDMLLHKLKIITDLREKVQEFTTYLRTEEKLGAKFYEQQNKVLNIFDLQEDLNLL